MILVNPLSNVRPIYNIFGYLLLSHETLVRLMVKSMLVKIFLDQRLNFLNHGKCINCHSQFNNSFCVSGWCSGMVRSLRIFHEISHAFGDPPWLWTPPATSSPGHRACVAAPQSPAAAPLRPAPTPGALRRRRRLPPKRLESRGTNEAKMGMEPTDRELTWVHYN